MPAEACRRERDAPAAGDGKGQIGQYWSFVWQGWRYREWARAQQAKYRQGSACAGGWQGQRHRWASIRRGQSTGAKTRAAHTDRSSGGSRGHHRDAQPRRRRYTDAGRVCAGWCHGHSCRHCGRRHVHSHNSTQQTHTEAKSRTSRYSPHGAQPSAQAVAPWPWCTSPSGASTTSQPRPYLYLRLCCASRPLTRLSITSLRTGAPSKRSVGAKNLARAQQMSSSSTTPHARQQEVDRLGRVQAAGSTSGDSPGTLQAARRGERFVVQPTAGYRAYTWDDVVTLCRKVEDGEVAKHDLGKPESEGGPAGPLIGRSTMYKWLRDDEKVRKNAGFATGVEGVAHWRVELDQRRRTSLKGWRRRPPWALQKTTSCS